MPIENVLTGHQVVHVYKRGISADQLSRHGGLRGMEQTMRAQLRDTAPCGLAGAPDEQIAVTCTAAHTTNDFRLYRATAVCVQPRCIQDDWDKRFLRALHDALDEAGGRDPNDELENLLPDFEGMSLFAAYWPGIESRMRIDALRAKLVAQAHIRFPELAP